MTFSTPTHLTLWLISGLSIVAILFACSENAYLAKAYYYPVEDLQSGMVYAYEGPEEDSPAPPFFMTYQSETNQEGTFLTGKYTDYNGQLFQETKEEIIPQGVLLHSMRFFGYDSLSGNMITQDADIIDANVFPFHVSAESGVVLSKFKWQSAENDAQTTTLTRNRRYIKDTSVVFEGQSLPAIVFDLKESIEVDIEGSSETSYGGREVYAKGIGLVFIEKHIAKDLDLVYVLKKRYSVAEFKNLWAQ